MVCLIAVTSQSAHALGGPTGVAQRPWYAYETEHFVVYSDYPEAVAAKRIQDLELFRAFVHDAMGLAGVEGQAAATPRLEVYLFSRRAHMIRIFNSTDVYGFMRPGLDRSLMVIAPVYGSASPNDVAFHEYVHYLLRNVGHTHLPPWYEEGLAEFFAMTQIRDNVLVIGNVNKLRVRQLRDAHGLAVEEVMTAGYPLNLDLPRGSGIGQTNLSVWGGHVHAAGLPRLMTQADFYSQSWSLMHMLLLGHRSGHERRDFQLADYVTDVAQGYGFDSAYSKNFSNDYKQLERDLKKYIAKLAHRYPRLELPIEAFDYDPRYRRVAVDEEAMLLRLGGLAAPLSPQTAGRLFQRVLRLNRNSTAALTGLGMARRRAGRLQDALDIGARAAGVAESSAAQFEYADTLIEVCRSRRALQRRRLQIADDALDCARLRETALEGYRRALALAPDNPRYLATLGVTLLQAGRLREATTHLEQAHAHAPWSPALNLALGESLRRQGEFARAEPLLGRAAVWFFKSPGLQAQALDALALARGGDLRVPGG
ncbi:MAG: tetratricopeptide repeat protein [Pseudomonadota bacterium]